jgi:outer membrane protein insertion porin family
LKEGDPFNSSLLDTDVYSIKVKYFNRGYLGVAVVDSVRMDGHSVDLLYTVEPGTQIRVRRIDISGNVVVSEKVIRKEFTFKPDEVCRLEKLIETQRNLFETGLFSIADIEPVNLDPLERRVDILVRVRERKAAYIEVGSGVGNILGSRVLGEFGTRNLFGTGRTFRLKTEYGYDIFEGEAVDFSKLRLLNTYYRYDAELHQRRVFNTKQLVSLTTFFEKDATVEDIEIKTLGLSISTTRRLSRRTDLILGWSSERIKRQAFELPEEASTSRIASASMSYDRRDFVLNPRTGEYRLVRVEGAGGILGGDNDFYTLSASYQRYHTLSRRVVFAWRVRTGYADAFGGSRDTGVPIENRYFAGGGNSVRGYEANSLGPRSVLDLHDGPVPVGGRVLALTNVELRYPVPLLSRINITGALFIDGGNVWAAMESIKSRNFRFYADEADVVQQDYRYSAGVGLRYNTPVGPIRVDYGIPVKHDEFTDKNGRFHVSLGQIF